MSVKYPAITDAQKNHRDHANNPLIPLFLDHVQNQMHEFVTEKLEAGATGVTVNEHVFVMPCKGKILKADFIMTTVQTGADNTPIVRLLGGTDIIGASAAIALSGAVGDVKALVLDADEVVVASGTKLIFRIVNPTATITVALIGKLQIIWKSVA